MIVFTMVLRIAVNSINVGWGEVAKSAIDWRAKLAIYQYINSLIITNNLLTVYDTTCY